VSPADGAVLAERLQQTVRAHNTAGPRTFELSLSVGTAHYDPEQPCSLQQLLAQADQRMYEAKRARRLAWSPAAGVFPPEPALFVDDGPGRGAPAI
jgi:GGDEF domain-containing protein